MSVDDVREAVRYWRRIGSPINAEPDCVEITLTQAEVLVELADAARERRSVSTCEWCNDADCTGDGICPCDYACHDAEYRADMALDAALARLDGEDTG